jgi:uncharacterized protein (UPF0333 family)
MKKNGQSSLDFLLGLLVLLIVLNTFSPVMDVFSDSHKELAVQQQLENDAEIAFILVMNHNLYYYDEGFYTNGEGSFMNNNTREYGFAYPSSIYTFEKNQGIECSIDKAFTALTFTAQKETTGLDNDIVVVKDLSLNSAIDVVDFIFKGCNERLEVYSG